MIITDGTTSYTFDTADGNGDYVPIKDVTTTAAGELRVRTAGHRYRVTEIFEVTGTELNNLIDLINNGASDYYYTPTTVPPEWDSSYFPMSVNITYVGKANSIYNGAIKYFISLDIESTEVFNQ